MTITGFEIDFLPVGEKSSSGDAILFRYEEDGEFKIILIDGGHKESDGVKTSDTILRHMQKYYDNYPPHIDHIVCSHPDDDHIGGLEEVIEKCSVGTLWINDPCYYVEQYDLAEESDKNRFSKADAEKVEALKKFAKSKGILIDQPLQGRAIGPFIVASPSEEFYKILVKGQLDRQGGEKARFKQKDGQGLLNRIKRIMVQAFWGQDNLMDYPATSVCNESSTVLFGNFGKWRVLLTADAGIEALLRAHKYLESEHDFVSQSLTFIQMPHHGSLYNVNTQILNKLLGCSVVQDNYKTRGYSIVSVANEDDPKDSVANAFITRGYSCHKTKGICMCFDRGNMPYRGLDPSTPIEFAPTVQELDN